MIMLAFRISELIRATFYAYIFQLLTDIETTLDLTAFYNIFNVVRMMVLPLPGFT